MATIKVLPETVQNKIAAGEVIERPASVVKELAENAIDAGARHIAVDLEEGGHRLIRVSDDGKGMDEDDLVACLQRHATSKINDVEDIFRIATFGFRGEALPSIGSVSRMSIATCQPGEKEGHEIFVEGGRIVRLSPAAPRKGTRVEVRDIFFNTPARRKFLRQPPAEATRSGEALTRLALGNPQVGFRLQVGERITLSLQPAASQKDRIIDLFGGKIGNQLIPFQSQAADGLKVSGFFAKPPESRRNSKDIYVLVNQRWIRYYGLARATADAFQGILPPREYPFAIIYLDVDPARVDVNAHPAKEEVRFEQESTLIAGVKRAIREALSQFATLPTISNVGGGRGSFQLIRPSETAQEGGAVAAAYSGPAASEERTEQKSLDMPGSFARSRTVDFSGIDLARTRERLRGIGRPSLGDAGDDDASWLSAAPTDGRVSGGTASPVAGEGDPAVGQREAAPVQPSKPGVSLGSAGTHRILGQAGGKYILVDGPDGLLLVDPHALHERWNFDRLVEERKRGGSARKLLLPLEMHLSPAESAAAEEAVPALAEYGFEFALTGPSSMQVLAAPAFLPPAKVENLLRQVLSDVSETAETLDAAKERLLASLACRSSVLLGKSLPEEEMLSLLDRFFHQGQMPTCPHGRPTAIRIGWDELARRFGR